MALDLTQHPCFNSDVRHRTGRIHLPVAPRCNIQCNYCDRKFDCANESRPGVTSSVLSPNQAMAYLDRAVEKAPHLKVVGIAGPGDPFANPEETIQTLRLVREKYPEMLLCVATNGLNAEPYVAELAQLQVSHVTFTVNAVDPAIGAQIYAWVRDGRAIYRNEAGASLLWERQKRAIAALKSNGVIVKINTIVMPGINDTHTEDVAIEMRALGVDIMNCIPLYPVKDTPFEDREQLGAEPMRRLRKTVQAYLPQMEHCTRCRADAVGLLGEAQRDDLVTLMRACADGTFDDELGNPGSPPCGGREHGGSSRQSASGRSNPIVDLRPGRSQSTPNRNSRHAGTWGRHGTLARIGANDSGLPGRDRRRHRSKTALGAGEGGPEGNRNVWADFAGSLHSVSIWRRAGLDAQTFSGVRIGVSRIGCGLFIRVRKESSWKNRSITFLYVQVFAWRVRPKALAIVRRPSPCCNISRRKSSIAIWMPGFRARGV